MDGRAELLQARQFPLTLETRLMDLISRSLPAIIFNMNGSARFEHVIGGILCNFKSLGFRHLLYRVYRRIGQPLGVAEPARNVSMFKGRYENVFYGTECRKGFCNKYIAPGHYSHYMVCVALSPDFLISGCC